MAETPGFNPDESQFIQDKFPGLRLLEKGEELPILDEEIPQSYNLEELLQYREVLLVMNESKQVLAFVELGYLLGDPDNQFDVEDKLTNDVTSYMAKLGYPEFIAKIKRVNRNHLDQGGRLANVQVSEDNLHVLTDGKGTFNYM